MSALGRIIRVLPARPSVFLRHHPHHPSFSLGTLLIFEITLPLSSAPQDGPHVHCQVLSLALLYPGRTCEHEYRVLKINASREMEKN